VYAVIAWKISGEPYRETKFVRTVVLAFLMALGFNVTDTPFGSIYASPFASTLTAALMSKFINKQQTKNPKTTFKDQDN